MFNKRNSRFRSVTPVSPQNAFLFDKDAWRYFMRCYRGYWRQLILYALIASTQSILVLPVLFLVRESFDTAIPNGDVLLLFLFAGGIVVARLLTSTLALGMRGLIIKGIKSAVKDMRQDIMIKLYALSRRFHSQTSIDDVHTQVVQDTERVDTMSNALFSGIMPAAMTSVVLFVVLLSLHWQLTLLTLLVFPLVYASTVFSGRNVKRKVFQFQRAFEVFSKGMRFVLRQIDLTRIQGYEDTEIRRQSGYLEDLKATGEKMAFSHALHRHIQTNVFGLAGLLILVVGGMSIASGSMSIGEFIAFYMAAGLLNGQVSSVIGGVPAIITGNESLVTLETLMRKDDLEPYSGRTKVDCHGNIDVRNVDFSYGQGPILQGLNLTIKPDSNIVIVGPNGGGKSTIVSLILGFWKPDAGSISVEEIPMEDVDIRNHRSSIGVVMQHPTMFAGSIRENITYGYSDVTDEEIHAAARAALAHDFIVALPEGYATAVGDSGSLLSGGERQKIAIARVLLGKPRFMVFDEPTNHLDSSSVGAILQSIYRSPNRPAILTISHDEKVIQYGEDIYLLENGQLSPLEMGRSMSYTSDKNHILEMD